VVNRAKIVVGRGTSFVFDKVVALERVFVAISSAVVSNAVGAEAVAAIKISAMVVVLERLRSAVSLIVGIEKIAVGVRQLLQGDTIEDMADEAGCQSGVLMLVDCQCFVPEPVFVDRPDGVVFQCLAAVSVSKR
jgi:hypothetical protein